LIKLEKLLTFSGQKRWILLAEKRSSGKAGNNRTLEAVGSTPIGSTKWDEGAGENLPLLFLFCKHFIL
jgi:hypothetical protein